MESNIFDRYISTVMHKIYQLPEGRMIPLRTQLLLQNHVSENVSVSEQDLQTSIFKLDC